MNTETSPTTLHRELAGVGRVPATPRPQMPSPPAVTPPTRAGFGSRLIKTMLAMDFGGTVELNYDPAGVTCILQVPAP